MPLPVLIDLPADNVLLLVQRGLLGTGDVAAILRGHVTFFLGDLVVLVVELICLTPRDITSAILLIDAAVLVIQAAIDLGTPRMCAVEAGGVPGNLTVDAVLLLIQRAIVGAREMAVIHGGHVTLFLADLMIFMVKLPGLAAA